MRHRHGLAVSLLLSLLIGCAKAPVSSVPLDTAKEKPRPARPIVAPAPVPPKKVEAPPAPARRDNPEIVTNKESGIIRGVVRWEGAQPAKASPRLRIDPVSHGIAQAVVQVLPPSKPIAPVAPEAVRLVIEQGEYRPHIVLAAKGGTIELRTIDERADFQASGAATFSETIQRGERRDFPLSSAGLIEVRSQLKPERTPAYIWVLDGTAGALSGADGQFRLPPMPAGEHELMLWHEDWHTSEEAAPRTVRVRIKLGPGEGAEVRWTLAER
jgi:hypothetical protein